MNPTPPGTFTPAMMTPPPPWAPLVPPLPPPSSAFWNTSNIRESLKNLYDTFNLAKALEKELEMLTMVKNGEGSAESDCSVDKFKGWMMENRIDLESHELLAVDAANAIMSKLRVQLEPFRIAADENSPWEEKSAVAKMSNKLHKYKRNKLWRKRKRKQIAEKLAKERDQFDQRNKEADEWRANEIAKEIAKGKVEKMKQIAKLKAREDKKKLESDLEVMLIVEKLQELRSIRIEKLKKQGRFLPEEDDKFLERVKAAVEEEERLAVAAADTDAAKDAIATAEETRTSTQIHGNESGESHPVETSKSVRENEGREGPSAVNDNDSRQEGAVGQSSSREYDYNANLPMEFYHYYYGGQTDMGTLIEVRRTWDTYIRPGGSRIPGHWVQPPPPSNEIWASYLVKPK
ncbi:OLC1v1000240C1 [Oldenlandia corymbosa var. corymbosa]|uniref:OLC1v1000240C1 n=1 Tax=Oldenlandia corymbosa var. corymbosa TaxID=529605 RepID=A0AAV1D5D9_OLDCO|nr:OLC1v1000240C1 [Oldenlandia corymbosa var. corymbosa]